MFKKPSQQGITSIVVVFVLVVLLTLVGIGFTKVMNRSLQSSSASQQASAASYAAQSGINDAISYIAKSLQANPGADVSSTQCGTLIDPGGPLEAAAKLSPDGSTAYTCILVDPNPSSLFYQNLAPNKSQVIKITTATPLTSLLLSWQASDRTRNQFVPAAKGTVLYDEKTWSDANYAPLLRVTLYPIPASGDLTNVQANTKTFFLYPQSGGSNSLAFTSPSGLTPVDCSSKSLGSFSGTADYDCNLVISNLASANASYFYARLTPFYAQSVLKVKANDASNQTVQFKNVQSVIDVTAKSGSAVKRLQARMDSSSSGSATDLNISSGSDNAPEFALQTASTLCKRLLIPPATSSPATIDPGSVLNCGLSLTDATPPAAPQPACSDSKDNDGDGKIDMADTGCSNPDDNDETDLVPGGGGSGDSQPTGRGGLSPVKCTIYSTGQNPDGSYYINGDCTNSSDGGHQRVLDNGCIILESWNYEEAGSDLWCPEGVSTSNIQVTTPVNNGGCPKGQIPGGAPDADGVQRNCQVAQLPPVGQSGSPQTGFTPIPEIAAPRDTRPVEPTYCSPGHYVETGGYWVNGQSSWVNGYSYWVDTGGYWTGGYWQPTYSYVETGYWATTRGHWVIDRVYGEGRWVAGSSYWVDTGGYWAQTGGYWTGQQWVPTGYWATTGGYWATTEGYWVPGTRTWVPGNCYTNRGLM